MKAFQIKELETPLSSRAPTSGSQAPIPHWREQPVPGQSSGPGARSLPLRHRVADGRARSLPCDTEQRTEGPGPCPMGWRGQILAPNDTQTVTHLTVLLEEEQSLH